jgi:hypothetical protein
MTPELAAQLDWMREGAFFPERFAGDERRRYLAEQQRIERAYDNQPL